MIQRCLAKRTRSESLVEAGKVDNQYLVGSASWLGHSISSHSSARSSLLSSSRGGGRTRRAAKRERRGFRVPSRQLTVFQAEGAKLIANSRTATGACLSSRRNRLVGRPIPFHFRLGSGAWPDFHT